jgi:hypothetical protein
VRFPEDNISHHRRQDECDGDDDSMTWKAIADNPADTDNILDIAFQNSVEN